MRAVVELGMRAQRGRDRGAHEIRKAARAQLMHDASPMNFDRSGRDVQFLGHELVRLKIARNLKSQLPLLFLSVGPAVPRPVA